MMYYTREASGRVVSMETRPPSNKVTRSKVLSAMETGDAAASASVIDVDKAAIKAIWDAIGDSQRKRICKGHIRWVAMRRHDAAINGSTFQLVSCQHPRQPCSWCSPLHRFKKWGSQWTSHVIELQLIATINERHNNPFAQWIPWSTTFPQLQIGNMQLVIFAPVQWRWASMVVVALRKTRAAEAQLRNEDNKRKLVVER